VRRTVTDDVATIDAVVTPLSGFASNLRSVEESVPYGWVWLTTLDDFRHWLIHAA
jgi:hypothetical protein